MATYTVHPANLRRLSVAPQIVAGHYTSERGHFRLVEGAKMDRVPTTLGTAFLIYQKKVVVGLLRSGSKVRLLTPAEVGLMLNHMAEIRSQLRDLATQREGLTGPKRAANTKAMRKLAKTYGLEAELPQGV